MQRARFDHLQGSSVHLDEAVTSFAVRHGRGRLLRKARGRERSHVSSGPRLPSKRQIPAHRLLSDTGLPSSLPSGARLTLRPKTCTDCRGPLDGMAEGAETSSSPLGAATGKGKRGANLAAFQGLRRRVVLSVATAESFTACGRDFGLAAERWARGAERTGPGSGRD